MRAVFFLDRDDTVIQNVPYLKQGDQIVFCPGAIEALQQIQAAGYGIVIITNQSGIGRGYYSVADYFKVEHCMTAQLKAAGIGVLKTYFCAHHPNAGCTCRKPSAQMLLAAQYAFDIEMSQSFMIGDKALDKQAGERAGVRGIQIGPAGEYPALIDAVQAVLGYT